MEIKINNENMWHIRKHNSFYFDGTMFHFKSEEYLVDGVIDYFYTRDSDGKVFRITDYGDGESEYIGVAYR